LLFVFVGSVIYLLRRQKLLAFFLQDFYRHENMQTLSKKNNSKKLKTIKYI